MLLKDLKAKAKKVEQDIKVWEKYLNQPDMSKAAKENIASQQKHLDFINNQIANPPRWVR